MTATLRTLRFYLGVGLLQGLLLQAAVLSGGLEHLVIGAACAGLLLSGGLLQLVSEHRYQSRTWWAALLLALAAAGLVMLCRGLPLTYPVLACVAFGLILLTLLSAAALHGRAGFGRRLGAYALRALLALPMPWIAQAAFKHWTSSQHLDPFKHGLLSLLFFAGPTLAFALGLYLAGRVLSSVAGRRAAAA
ncbi:hypothetical protein J4P02_04430 [Pseudomonas sp. NFXW11]|uniref:hypothetical protein n=1 Tax=Pseudomonas sp. NFXW11 TaxID=2819531 RepID=UPI003CF59D36